LNTRPNEQSGPAVRTALKTIQNPVPEGLGPKHKQMTKAGIKSFFFLIEAINSFATSYYFYYFFFFTRDVFGFSSTANLGTCALHGLVYMGAARFGGNYGQKKGYFKALRLGFVLMLVLLLAGSVSTNKIVHILLLMAWTFAMCFTWPVLEALVSQNETSQKLSQLLGVYNLVWAGASALTYFFGGALFQKLGSKSLFLIPAALHFVQLLLLAYLERRASQPMSDGSRVLSQSSGSDDPAPRSSEHRAFLTMARVANPFAYVAMNAAIPIMPYLSLKFHLTLAQAGFFGSIWFFARMAAFFILWRWEGWHYRFPLLLGSVVGIIAGFASILLLNSLHLVIAAQILFGLSVGLVYYSSLFYSMDLGGAKAEHGGIHEAAIGAGVFTGSAVGALSGVFFPGNIGAGVWPVTAILFLGCGALIWLRSSCRR